MVNTSVTLSGLVLENPVIPASGLLDTAGSFVNFTDINILAPFL